MNTAMTSILAQNQNRLLFDQQKRKAHYMLAEPQRKDREGHQNLLHLWQLLLVMVCTWYQYDFCVYWLINNVNHVFKFIKCCLVFVQTHILNSCVVKVERRRWTNFFRCGNAFLYFFVWRSWRNIKIKKKL